jgi:hypothetical protein
MMPEIRKKPGSGMIGKIKTKKVLETGTREDDLEFEQWYSSTLFVVLLSFNFLLFLFYPFIFLIIRQ